MQGSKPVECEVLNVIQAAGIWPDCDDKTQLLQAINTLISGGGNGGGGGATPLGTVLPFAGATAPDGFMLCDGAELFASEHADLFAVIGTVYGEGEAPGSFKLPDLRGRAAIGAGQGVDLSDRVLGAMAGAETHQLTVDEMPVILMVVLVRLVIMPGFPPVPQDQSAGAASRTTTCSLSWC